MRATTEPTPLRDFRVGDRFVTVPPTARGSSPDWNPMVMYEVMGQDYISRRMKYRRVSGKNDKPYDSPWYGFSLLYRVLTSPDDPDGL